MITNIVFFVGGIAAAEPIGRFRGVHKSFFDDAHVVATDISDALSPGKQQPIDLPALLADSAFAPQARSNLEALCYNRPAHAETLLLFRAFIYRDISTLSVQASLCRQYFPHAGQRAIFAPSPALPEAEAACARLLIYGYPIVASQYYYTFSTSQPLLSTTLTALESIFSPTELTVIPYLEEESLCRAFTAALFSNQPEMAENAAHLPFAPSPVNSVLPRDVLAFMEGMNQLYKASGEGQSPFIWRKYPKLLQAGQASSGFSVPDLQTELQKKFNTADRLALLERRLLAWPAEKPAKEPADKDRFQGLSDEEFARFALFLPRADIDEMLHAQRLSSRYQSRAARQALRVLQRLDAAAAEPGATPKAAPAAGPVRIEVLPPELTVLTTTYNHAPYIRKCMESVMEQQVRVPFQHIIADDASTDGTQDIILEYASKHPHIIPIFQKKRSFGPQNLYSLFDMARSKYVAICEGDDYFCDPAKLQTQLDFLEKHKDCSLCFHVVRVEYEDNPERQRFYPPLDILPQGVRPFYALDDLIKGNFIQTNSVVYRWRFQSGLPDWFRPDLCPGDWYWHLLHAETGKIGFINKIMSVYRRHKNSVYYLAEIDALRQRANVGVHELEVFHVLNKHFKKRFQPVLLDLSNAVFADCMLYDSEQMSGSGAATSHDSVLDRLALKYPEFAKHFLNSLAKATP